MDEPDRIRVLLVGLIRELFGDPFPPAAVESAWLTPAVLTLANAAYAEQVLPKGHLETARKVIDWMFAQRKK